MAAAGASPQYLQDSLPSLPEHLQSDTQLTAHLASRFHAHLPTARLSSHALITLNTYTSSSKGPNGGEEGSCDAAVKELGARAYARLGHRKEDQAVIFLGETGSGKSQLRSTLLKSVLTLSSTPLSKKLSYANFVFDSLTGTKTATSPYASKAGLYFELQYDTTSSLHPTLIGGKLLDHRLERSRVTSIPPGERSFHILYYLLTGTSSNEKAHLCLDNPGSLSDDRLSGGRRWRYLGHPSQLKVGIDDTGGFDHFRTALRTLEFPRSEIAEFCRILAAILHIGQLEFTTTKSTAPAPGESGGYSHEGGEDITVVRNQDSLKTVSAFLGVRMQDLEQSLGSKTKTLHRERVTVMLDPAGARANADELAKTLYSLLVAYIIEAINSRLCAVEETIGNTISVVDFPGFAQLPSTGQVLEQLLNNAACEQLYHICLHNFFERQAEMLDTEEVTVAPTSYFDNSEACKGLLRPGNGVLAILDDQARRGKTDFQFLESLRKRFANKNPAITIGSGTTIVPGSNFPTQNAAAAFSVKHYAGEVDYPIDGLIEANSEVISGDMMNLFGSTVNDFVGQLFGQEVLTKITHPKERTAIVQASVASKPSRMPSMARRKIDRLGRFGSKPPGLDDETTSEGESRPSTSSRKGHADMGQHQGVAAQFLSSLNNITKSVTAHNTNSYFVFCLKPNDRRIANQFDSKCVRSQIQEFGIAEMSQRLRNADFSVFVPFGEFLTMVENETVFLGSDKEKVENHLAEKKWPSNEAIVGLTGVFLSERCWFEIVGIPSGLATPASRLNGAEMDDDGRLTPAGGFGDSKLRLLPSQTPKDGYFGDDKNQGYFGSRDLDAKSDAGVSAINGDMFRNLETRDQLAEKSNEKREQVVEEYKTSASRVRWLVIVYGLTWLLPDFLLRWVMRQPRKDVRVAWREKLAINMLIWLSCAFVVFFMIGFPELICPRQDVFSPAELSTHNGKGGANSYIAMRGVVYDLDNFIPRHYPNIIPQSALKKYAGLDATALFPVQVSALCNGINGSVDNAVQLNYVPTNYTTVGIATSATDPNARYHDFRWFTNDSRPDWWWEQQYMLQKTYMKGHIGYTPEYVKTLGAKQNSIAILNSKIYDLTQYIAGGRQALYPIGTQPESPPPDTNFMDQTVVDLFQQLAGQDVSKYWENLPIDSGLKSRMLVCLNNLFFVGDVDTRNSAQCLFAKYILLAISILLVSVIGFKFLAALQFGAKNVPENLDKFVICQVPAYTEDEESLRRAIDSAARMRYDDKRKLLIVICDGMIVGAGNDRPTPRIVLDILGVSETADPESLSFESLGEGQRQHNMGKVYSGLYEVQGHIVPFLVVVKVGKPSEVAKPGNRGKRDSQMILMRFLNRVHYNLPMSPLELEMHHQIRNIIGVNPTFYEYCLQIDADTVVAPDSATRMISAFVNDTRLIGVCGETALTNAKTSIITMMQVYEYYISHNLTKAFESLFGSVTCLPGCFSMYRIRAADTGKPLFVSKEVIDAYSEIRVDTLHMKNLLHLGEDRYLTTLLLKYHSKYKTKYIFRAHAWTIAPDTWRVFLSQRRRWINSTVHNLIELIPLQQLCGFCCFSMRFVVFLDLLSTIVQPVIVGYIAYLIVLLASRDNVVPLTAFILLGSIYGLQAIIFILRRKWEMIGWMVIYMLATPIFAFGLPLYAFWHMDDFSWGNTRIVTGEKGKKVVVSDEGKFDPSSIPKKRWEEYQAELWDQHTQLGDDTRSEVSGVSYGTKSFVYGAHPAAMAAAAVPIPGGPLGVHDVYGTGAGLLPRPMSHLDLRYSTSRLSLAQQPGGHMGEMEMAELNGGNPQPTDDALLAEIRDILRTANLMTVTKKQIRAELEQRFGVTLEARKAYINSATEALLSGQL